MAATSALALLPGVASCEPAPRPSPTGPSSLRLVGFDRTQRAAGPVYQRALLLWPGLDRGRLGRTRGDPRKIARLVARRTIHSEETILALLART